MLAISQAASAVITNALAQSEAPEGAGLRLAAGEVTERGMAIEVGFVASALPEDQVIHAGEGADVFVEPATAELLTDQVLDADVQPDQITFSLHPQPQDPSMNGSTPQT